MPLYAITDIETTGGYADANGITEISIKIFDGEKIVSSYETLVNPLKAIQPYVQSLTGISNAMVSQAPVFADIAEKVYDLLKDKIFVAHSVNFDFSFLKKQLSANGFDWDVPKLCTIRLSRKIIPGLPSYSLGNLCDSLKIKINNQHRAEGDARATTEVFKFLLQHDTSNFIHQSVKRNSKERSLPPNVPKEQFEALPFVPGVYYFHDKWGKIIYVGKAKNIRYRVLSHFTNNSGRKQKQDFVRYVYKISFHEMPTELMAAIFESIEIKRLFPRFNVSQKFAEPMFGIYSYTDQGGYLRLMVEKKIKSPPPHYTSHYQMQCQQVLKQMVEEFTLCPKMCFVFKTNVACSEDCNGACEKKESKTKYNNRVKKAIKKLEENFSFLLLDKGMTAMEKSCVLVENGVVTYMGSVDKNMDEENCEALKKHLQPIKDNSVIKQLVNREAEKYPEKLFYF